MDSQTGTQRQQLSYTIVPGPRKVSIGVAAPTVERRMAVANALPSARFEVRDRSPMEVTDNGLGTFCGCYFRVADKPLGIDVTSSWRLCLPAV